MSFLKAEYTILSMFVIAVALLLGYAGSTQGESSSPLIALSFALRSDLFGAGRICRDESGDQSQRANDQRGQNQPWAGHWKSPLPAAR